MGRDVTKVAIVAGTIVAGLVFLPVLEEIAVIGVLFLLAVVCLVIFLVAALWHVARRHPTVGVLVGAWLVHRHDRRVRRAIDARSWLYPSSWAPPDPRSRSPW